MKCPDKALEFPFQIGHAQAMLDGKTFFLCVTFLLYGGCFVGCEKDVSPSTNPAKTVTFGEISDLLVEKGCAESNCHQGATPKANLNLEPDFAYDNLVNISCSLPGAAELGLNLVTPGEPDESFLYVKVTLTHSDPTFGLPMPLTGQGLHVDELERIREWIEAGALR